MRLVYADTSALARLYLVDEPGSRQLERLLLRSDDPVATSELSHVELARAVKTAERSGRLRSAEPLLRAIQEHLGSAIALVALHPGRVLPDARRLVLERRVRTLDAIHLAVALELEDLEGADELVFVTRDADQSEAAAALGFSLA